MAYPVSAGSPEAFRKQRELLTVRALAEITKLDPRAVTHLNRRLVDEMPGITEQYIHARNHKQEVSIVSPELGPVAMKYIELNGPGEDEELPPGTETYIIMGGSISSPEAMSTTGMALAALGKHIIMLPHVWNLETSFPDTGKFEKQFTQYEARNGVFSADGYIVAEVIKQLAREKGIEQTWLLAISSGASVMLRAAEELVTNKTEEKPKLKGVVCLSPSGFYDVEDVIQYSRLWEASRVLRAFLTEGKIIEQDPDEWLHQMQAVGEQAIPNVAQITKNPLRYLQETLPRAIQLVKLPYRCVNTVLRQVSPVLNVPLIVGYGRGDPIFQKEIVEQTIADVNRQRGEKGQIPIIPFGVMGSHSWPVQGNYQLAIDLYSLTEKLPTDV